MRNGFVLKVVLMLVLMFMASGMSAEATNMTCAVHKGEWVWVRDTPSPDGEKIGTIRYGVEGEIHEIQNGYARISANNGCAGWADVSYFDVPIKEEIWVVNTDDPVNKRETPDGRFMTKIRGGSRISVLGWRYSKKGELWAKVFHGGYVKAQYLSKVEQEESK